MSMQITAISIPHSAGQIYRTSLLDDRLAMGTLEIYTTVTYNIMVNGPKYLHQKTSNNKVQGLQIRLGQKEAFKTI